MVSRFNLILVSVGLAAFGIPTRASDVDFNRDIRPILSENCFYCHGQDANKRQSDLRLDVREAVIDYGAMEPGDPDSSLLIERIFSEDADTQMPPPASHRQLTEAQKKLLQKWIEEGANYQNHWAFLAPVRPAVPEINNQDWPRNPIDRFVLAKLEQKSWSPSPVADRPTLIKRLHADLIGLPPTPAEVEAFVHDPNPAAYENLVDRLLANPHYGERLALPWLDAARYADSNGFQQDGDTWQWMWRDWVVSALNDDLPFDQFTIWQLAGDLLPGATTEQKIASGFNRNHLLNGEGGAIAEEQRFNGLFDRIDTTATTWLGLTMACAQCHDHKYDPITQNDYYSMMDAFNRVPESGTPQYYSSRIRLGNPVIELPTPENEIRIAEFENQIATANQALSPLMDAAYEGWKAGIESNKNVAGLDGAPDPLRDLLPKPKSERSEEIKTSIEANLRKWFDEKFRDDLAKKTEAGKRLESLEQQLANYRADQIPRPMVMSDDQPRETHVLDRGAYLSPLEKVTFHTPSFLPPLSDAAPQNRLGFAHWLMSDEHPLTARVQVNRMWQYFFGIGIVKTSEDFGVQSEYPIHKDLLDWLAVEFRESGWRTKKLHRLIVTSSTYRQSSRLTAKQREFDLENRFFSRATRMRMPSLILRDWALASSELLTGRIGGQPVYPYQPGEVWESLAITKERDFTYPRSTGDRLYRRSLYTFWRRTVSPSNMFDAANRQTCQVRVSSTSTPLHALTTLNDPTWIEAARVLAENSLRLSGDADACLRSMFQRIVCRQPTETELAILRTSFQQQHKHFESDNQSAIEFLAIGESSRDESLDLTSHAALSVVCLGIFNLDEALTRE